MRENIPHNLFITHGKSFESVKAPNLDKSRDCLRIYIWARKPNWGTHSSILINYCLIAYFKV